MSAPSPYRGFRCPAELIQYAVWLYQCFSLSLRDVELILAACDIVVSYETIRELGLHVGRLFVRIQGKLHYLWRAFDQSGHVLAILVQSRRNAKAAKRFFRKLLRGLQYVPRVIVTDKLRSYGAAKRDVLPGAEHRQSRYLNIRAEVSQQPTRRRERQRQRFKSARHAQRLLSAHSRILNHSSFAVTASQPNNTVPLATKPFKAGAISPELLGRRELDADSGRFDIFLRQPDRACGGAYLSHAGSHAFG